MGEGTPARIDRAALERIIQRAAELQTGERDIGEELTPEQVLALGREVGIPGSLPPAGAARGAHPRRRGAPRGRVGADRGPGAGHGPARGARHRGRRRGGAGRWMEEKELFCVQRQQPGRITWEPLGGVAAAVRRSTAAFSRGSAAIMLVPGRHRVATIVPLEPGWCHVTLTAETAEGAIRVRRRRAPRSRGAGAVGAGLMVVLGALLPVALLPVPVGVGHRLRAWRASIGTRSPASSSASSARSTSWSTARSQRAASGQLPAALRAPDCSGILAEEDLARIAAVRDRRRRDGTDH